MAIKVVVEMKAKPGERDRLKHLLDALIAEIGPGLKDNGWLGSTLHEALDDPEVLVEIADWQTAAGHQAVMGDLETAEAGTCGATARLTAQGQSPRRALRPPKVTFSPAPDHSGRRVGTPAPCPGRPPGSR